ncbi:hypothetical protein VPH35_007940 [Triticum aestivum]
MHGRSSTRRSPPRPCQSSTRRRWYGSFATTAGRRRACASMSWRKSVLGAAPTTPGRRGAARLQRRAPESERLEETTVQQTLLTHSHSCDTIQDLVKMMGALELACRLKLLVLAAVGSTGECRVSSVNKPGIACRRRQGGRRDCSSQFEEQRNSLRLHKSGGMIYRLSWCA